MNTYCEWGSRDDCLDVATTVDVIDPFGNIVTLNLCENCMQDHNLACESAPIGNGTASGYPL